MNAHNAFDRAFWQAVDDMHVGEAKPIESYLKLVAREEQDELALMLADVLAARGPAPTPSATESAGYAQALAIIDEVLGSPSPAGMLPVALKTMRDARGIEREHVINALASDFGIRSAAGRQELERQYHYLESGKQLGTKLKRSLMESLARIFDIDVRDLLAGARPTGEAPRLTGAPVPAMGRGAGSAASGRAIKADDVIPDPEIKLVRQLFHGGPDG
jgi:hypothetical protein